MEKAIKFLGKCILISVIILSLSISFYGLCNRYYLERHDAVNFGSYIVFDKLTGVYYFSYSDGKNSGNYKVDLKKDIK
jgi:hypothetical protein